MKDILKVCDRKNQFPVAGTEIEEVLMQHLPKLDKHAALRGGGGVQTLFGCTCAALQNIKGSSRKMTARLMEKG